MIVKGQKINNRYEIIKMLGEGGMANVYLAQDTILDRKVAVKVLRGDLANDEKFVRRFQRESLAASSLSHPNIVEMYDVGEDEGNFFIVMEYVDGKTLKQLIRKRGSLTIQEVIDIMLQLTDGLAHAHDSYIIHRDIKPQNILIVDSGLVKITDFGIAMALNSSQLTQTNSVMGSVHYLPPEQASGKGSTIKSDIYSLGVLMYELLTGKLPFRGDNAVEIALKHMKEPIPSIKKELDDVPNSIENIIMRATSKNPKNRYNDAREMYQDLKTALDKERKNEPRHVYKYPEVDLEETKIVPALKENGGLAKQVNENEYRPNKKLITTLIITSIFIISALVIMIFIVPTFNRVEDIKIPNVVGMTIENAERTLKAAGFKIDPLIKEMASEKVEENHVIKTSPTIGKTVKEGTVITLYKSNGVQVYKIENYVGKDYVDIKTTLELKGIEVVIEKKDVEDVLKYKDKRNIIIEQSVSPDTELKMGDSITLYLPNVFDTYPDMVLEKWNQKDVELFANEYGLSLSIQYQETDQYNPDVVVSQSRSYGSKIVTGASFSVTISKAKSAPIEEETPQ